MLARSVGSLILYCRRFLRPPDEIRKVHAFSMPITKNRMNMAWNFRKRIKIAPGVHLNLSKGGVSTSIGPKGAKISIGKNGTYLNTSIPGTGLYSRQKISGKRLSTPRSSLMDTGTNNTSISNNSVLVVFAVILLFVGILFIVLS